jgi:glc operon protein GlcG
LPGDAVLRFVVLLADDVQRDDPPLACGRGKPTEEAMNEVTRRSFVLTAAAAGGALGIAGHLQAQIPQYGGEINLEQAKKALAAAEEEARKNSWSMAIAIVDNHGFLVAFEKMDDTHTASVQIAIDKATVAAMFRRPTKALQDAVAGGGAGLRILSVKGAIAIEGGFPIIVGGKIIGGVGVSGANADQDAQVAKAAASAVT